MRSDQARLAHQYLHGDQRWPLHAYIVSICVVQTGRIVEETEPRDLFSAPSHPYTRALLDAVPGAH
ncbi:MULTISPECIES: hypothetical protein [Roseobacteraceae]|nr:MULTISPECIES: hypothetical protein [Roseobacteraceae]KAB6718212.1 hypothetical protein C8029_00020 [Roseobacter sp. TSBP12]